MASDNQQKFYDACCEVRKYWGLTSSTFEQISNLLAKALSASIQDGVDKTKADIHFSSLWEEWVRWRSSSFLLQERKKIAATISKWPNGNHFYVSLIGDGVHEKEKFNTQVDAQKFYNKRIRHFQAQGKEIVDSFNSSNR